MKKVSLTCLDSLNHENLHIFFSHRTFCDADLSFILVHSCNGGLNY